MNIDTVIAFITHVVTTVISFFAGWIALFVGQDVATIELIISGLFVLLLFIAIFNAIPSAISSRVSPDTSVIVLVLVNLACFGVWQEFNISQGSQEALVYFLPFSRDALRVPSMLPSLCQWLAGTVFNRTKDRKVRVALYTTVGVDTLLTTIGFGLGAGLPPAELVGSPSLIPFALSASFFNVAVEELWMRTWPILRKKLFI